MMAAFLLWALRREYSMKWKNKRTTTWSLIYQAGSIRLSLPGDDTCVLLPCLWMPCLTVRLPAGFTLMSCTFQSLYRTLFLFPPANAMTFLWWEFIKALAGGPKNIARFRAALSCILLPYNAGYCFRNFIYNHSTSVGDRGEHNVEPDCGRSMQNHKQEEYSAGSIK